ncbi:MAG: type II toxin-antitoxin system VapC family toxin [Nodosilinea sp.]
MSKVIVLDTHTWFWFIKQDFARFPRSWRDDIETAEQVGVSAISCFEIALAEQRGRIELPCPTAEWLDEALEPSGIMLLPLTAAVSCRAVSLSPVHKDPFDRLIIATALVYEAQLASVDTLFPRYPELQGCLME